MKLFAISDLHVGHKDNWQALQELPPHPDDWLIVAGDICESATRFAAALQLLSSRFARVFWAPGNHDLWTMPRSPIQLRGQHRYEMLVKLCRRFGVLTPEDEYAVWLGEGGPFTIAPIFTLYDYSFRPDHVTLEGAVDWAAKTDVICADEYLLHPDPYPSRIDWCQARCRYTEQRLADVDGRAPLLLASHFPLHRELAVLRRIPRFSIWCGTTLTEDWPQRFPIKTAVYGHLHIRGSYQRQDVRFEEVSLGYPYQWRSERGVEAYLRQILP